MLAPTVARMIAPGIDYFAISTVSLLAVFVILLPEACTELRTLWQLTLCKIALPVALFCWTSWEFVQGPTPINVQWGLYAALPLFWAAVVGWFRQSRDGKIALAFQVKLGLTVVCLIWFSVVLSMAANRGDLMFAWEHPPIYSNIRQYNYDLAAAIPLAAFLLWRSAIIGRLTYCSVLSLLGFFTVWTAGRGEMLALAIFAGAMFYASGSHIDTRFRWAIVPLMFGGSLVFALNMDVAFVSQLGRSFSDSSNAISSNRIVLWHNSLARVGESVHSLLFGFGPDAFLRLNIMKPVQGEGGLLPMVLPHPHNFIIQWLLDFGLLGTSVLLAVWGAVCLKCVRVLRAHGPLDFSTMVAALLLAFTVYGLVDGLFYQPVPLVFTTICAAYLHTLNAQRTQHANLGSKCRA